MVTLTDSKRMLAEKLREELLKQAFVPDVIKYDKNPIIVAGDLGGLEIYGPTVFASKGKYYLISGLATKTWDTPDRLILLSSSDGLKWSTVKNPLVEPPSGYSRIGRGNCGICLDQEAKLWRIFAVIYSNSKGRYVLGQFTSPKLEGPYSFAGEVWDPGASVSSASIVYIRFPWYLKKFNLYAWAYRGVDGHLLVSNDAVTWTDEGKVVWGRPPEIMFWAPSAYNEGMTVSLIRNLFIMANNSRGVAGDGLNILASIDGRNFWPYKTIPLVNREGVCNEDEVIAATHHYIYSDREKLWDYYCMVRWRDDLSGWQHYALGVAFLNPALIDRVMDSPSVYFINRSKIWKEASISAGETAVAPLNLLGYSKKSLYFESDTAGDLTISIDPIGDGNFKDIVTRTSITSTNELIEYDFAYLRLKFSASAKVTARLVAVR